MYSEEGFFCFVFLIFIFEWDIRKYLYYTLKLLQWYLK